MKKKVLSLVLVGCTLLVGCGGADSSKTTTLNQTTATAQAVANTEEKTVQKEAVVAETKQKETTQTGVKVDNTTFSDATATTTEYDGIFTEVPFTFDGMEMKLPQEPTAFYAAGWYTREAETLAAGAEESITLYNDNYSQVRLIIGLENITESELPAEQCVMTDISVKNTYLDAIVDEYPEMNYCGVTYSMSYDEVISLLGTPTRETESDPIFEGSGNLHIMNYNKSGDGMSAEIWVYENLGVTQYRLSTF